MPEFSLTDLREEAPQATQASASQATASQASQIDPSSAPNTVNAEASYAGSRDAAARDANATGYAAVTGEVDPQTMTAAGQTNMITGQDSPLMRRARSEGLLTAGKRGLGNSSIAAGASMGAMVDRASPLAMQDAQTYFQNMRANLDARNRAAEVSTGRETDVSMANAELATRVELANADAANQIAALNAQMETAVNQQNAEAANQIQQQILDLNAQIDMRNAELATTVSQTNAGMATDVSIQNSAAQNELNRTALVGNQELNRQFLAGEQAVSLAEMQSKYQALLQANETAANLYNSYLQGLSTLMGNPDVRPSRIAEYTRTLTTQLEGGLEFIDNINSIDFMTGESTTVTPPAQPAPSYPTYPPIMGTPTTGGGTTTGGTTGGGTTYPGVPTYGTPEWQQWIGSLNLGSIGL